MYLSCMRDENNHTTAFIDLKQGSGLASNLFDHSSTADGPGVSDVNNVYAIPSTPLYGLSQSYQPELVS